MALGASTPPNYTALYDSTMVYNSRLHPWLNCFGQVAKNNNPSAINISPVVADIPSSHSSIGDFGGSAPLLASVHSLSRDPNADSGRHQVSKGNHHPYNYSVTLFNRRKARQPPAAYEPNVTTLQERLRREGGDNDAVMLVQKVFSNGVALAALTRRQTREEMAQQVFGQGGGPVYLAFLETLPLNERENRALETRFRCRLCPNNADALSWKHQRDVLRHLRRDHFGFGEMCFQWYVCAILHLSSFNFWLSGKQVYTKSEMGSHRCKIPFA
jgi:hypothetical protein